MIDDEASIAKDIYMHHFDDDVKYPDVLKAIIVGVQKGTELKEGQIEELEKENAELKKGLSVLNASNSFNKEQLSKAKDLLLRFIELKNKPCAAGHSVNMLLYENICVETEQFLKEVSDERTLERIRTGKANLFL